MTGTNIYVEVAALDIAAHRLRGATGDVSDAHAYASRLNGHLDAFGGEPIGVAYTEMAERAVSAMQAIEEVMGSLGANVSLAAAGYVETDKGLIPLGAAEM